MSISAIVLAGGTGRRFGGDKLAAPLGQTTVLDATLAGLPTAWPIVCVGPQRPVQRDVIWTREDPPLGGPVAAMAAGLRWVTTELVLILAGDQPYAATAAIRLVALLETSPEVDGVVATDPDGRVNPLLSAFRAEALRKALPEDPSGAAARSLLAGLRVARMPISASEAHDIDAPDDLPGAPS